MKKPVFAKVKVPLIPGWFALCLADTLRDAVGLSNAKFFKNECQLDLDCDAGLYREKNLFAFVCPRKYLTHGVIAHEIYHGTARILEYACVQASHDNCEAGAYLCEFLTNWIYRTLRANRESIRTCPTS